MSDSLGPLTDQLVGRRDDSTGSIFLTGWAAGPAGLATVFLGGGDVELSVDYAEPATVSQIVIPSFDAPKGLKTEALNSLFSGAWNLLESRLAGEPKVVWRPDEEPISWRRGSGVVGQLGRLAILEAETTERHHSPAGLAISSIERAVIAAGLPEELRVAPNPPDLFVNGGTALLDIGLDQLHDELDWRGRLELAALVSRGLQMIDLPAAADIVGQLEELGSRLRGDTPRAAAAPAAAMMPSPQAGATRTLDDRSLVEAEAAPRRRARERVGEHDVPVEIDPALDAEVMQVNVNNAHLEVAVRATDKQGLWLRLFRTDRRPVLLEMGQMQVNDFGSASAAVMVPRDIAQSDLVADVTDRPQSRWQAPSVRVTQRAVRQGRDACRAERDSDFDQAAESWRQSASNWRAVGDDRRSALARRYADGQSPVAPRTVGGRRHARGGRREPMAAFVLDRLARP